MGEGCMRVWVEEVGGDGKWGRGGGGYGGGGQRICRSGVRREMRAELWRQWLRSTKEMSEEMTRLQWASQEI